MGVRHSPRALLPSFSHPLTDKLGSIMAAALEHFSDRLMAGARTDLLELAKIPFIKSRTA